MKWKVAAKNIKHEQQRDVFCQKINLYLQFFALQINKFYPTYICAPVWGDPVWISRRSLASASEN